MKFLDLKPLNIQRLKAYRKSLQDKLGAWGFCECCGYGCEYALAEARQNPNYVKLRTEIDRVHKELASKQKAEQKVNPAHVPTVAEEKNRYKVKFKLKQRL